MTQELTVRILLPNDLEATHAFARKLAGLSSESELEVEMLHWSAPWRPESLEHYLKLGWSFAAFDQEQNMLGYVLAQPVLFFRGQTQTIWAEDLGFNSPEVGQKIVETLWRWCRDKHIQRLLFANRDRAKEVAKDLKGSPSAEGWWEMPTTRSLT